MSNGKRGHAAAGPRLLSVGLYLNCPARFNGINSAADNLNPNLFICGIIDFSTIGAENKRVICRHIIMNFDIRCVPCIFMSAELFADFFNSVPVIVSVKLKAVSPHIEQTLVSL